ncbi:MAG TPA: PqqD family protein [Solirubrobacterales bacterium]|nr:PqqD family protein [Solirubrobacterales bacterium]
MPQRFRISPEIVHETVDGEVIAIDLDNGSYYSLAGGGPLIWVLLAEGASEAELRDALAARFGELEAIAGDVSALLRQLQENGLIVEHESNGNNAALAEKAASGEAYEAPRFERYTDMKDYFLLDPIHEVDNAGWPRPAG